MEIRTTYTVKGSKGQDKTFPSRTEAEAYLANEELVKSAANHLEELFLLKVGVKCFKELQPKLKKQN